MVWCPVLLARRDGSQYGMHLHFTRVEAKGFLHKTVTARIENPDGSEIPIDDVAPRLRFDPANRRLLGGELDLRLRDGSARTVSLEVLSDTGVHLGAGLYFGFDEHHHGEWRGELHVDGERIRDCTAPEQARRLHQIRDTAVRLVDPTGGGVGVGNCQPIAYGPWPELGLDDEAWM
jgi:hypothetical protein